MGVDREDFPELSLGTWERAFQLGWWRSPLLVSPKNLPLGRCRTAVDGGQREGKPQLGGGGLYFSLLALLVRARHAGVSESQDCWGSPPQVTAQYPPDDKPHRVILAP